MYARRRFKKKQKDLIRLGDFLPVTLQRKKIYLSARDHELARVWKSAVGPLISNQTDPVRCKEGKLYVNVATSAWMQQLQFLKSEIMSKLNEHSAAKKITSLHFSIGTIPEKANPAPAEGDSRQFDQTLLRPRDKRLIEENLSSISDEGLRSIIKRVMIKEIITRHRRS